MKTQRYLAGWLLLLLVVVVVLVWSTAGGSRAQSPAQATTTPSPGTPSPTIVPCTPPPCPPGGWFECPSGTCPGGCGIVCVTPTAGPLGLPCVDRLYQTPSSPSPSPSFQPVCTPPPCPTGGWFECPSGSCPGGCGVVCVTPTVAPTPSP